MPRRPRVVLPRHPHHVTQRGNRRQRVFFSDHDYRYYLRLLAEACAGPETSCWAYCLMPNHVHFVLVPQRTDGLSTVMGEAHRRYTRRVNLREGWCGHLWQDRFYSAPMDEIHLLAAVRYIERNPVRAGLVSDPQQWPWSSARAHLHGADDRLVMAEPMRALISDWQAYLSGYDDTVVTERLRKHTRTGRPLGSDPFIELAERVTGRALRPRKRGPKRARRDRP